MNTNAANDSSTDSQARAWLDTLGDSITKSSALKPWLLDTAHGILTQTSTRQNVGSAVIFFWPESWSEESKAEISAYLKQVSSWIRQKVDNMVSREEIMAQKWEEGHKVPEPEEEEDI